ncbi:hypothetical protein LOCC1_G001697 [Lachnellula occidentalis]|uniref:Guanine nucleotide-exchange factor SEC12 n=1 Tax=Lachnellula occidentalis TaxID=215460 RepID=A0A8H8UK08_9HELO|nr:hypothetical protein LOCC1_G001697 [Lachnellula occidentalis]
MAPLIPSAKATLSYPLYACDFDPLDPTRLLVAGGGGAGRSGVGNKITLLDTSKANEIEEAAEIDLSRDEDNVTSLAVGQQNGNTTLVFAGINSSPEDVAAGKNLHFRVFGIEDTAPKTKGKGKGKAKADTEAQKPAASNITEISRVSLFQGKDKNAYQRLLRLSKPFPNQPQLGAVATGLEKEWEIVLFNASTKSPPSKIGSILPHKEAVDMDILPCGQGEFLFAYCDNHDIYVKKITKSDTAEPSLVYSTPGSRSTEKVTVPAFRALRWLTKDLLLMLTNIHGNAGVVLQILRIPPSGTGQSRIAQSVRLPSRLSKATGLAVANLTPPVEPSAPQDYTQFVIAVAGQDFSISLFKVDLQVEGGVSLPSAIKPFRTLRAVHPFTITSLVFSNFTPPTHPITASTPPQYLKLASVSVNNTVVVHILPLFPVPLSMKLGQSRTPRYVVALPSTAAAWGMAIVVSTLAILLGAVFIQGLLEVRGGVPVWINARNHVPLRLQEIVGRPYEFPSGYNSIPTSVSSGYNHHLGVPTDSSESGSALRLPEFFEKMKGGAPDDVYVITHYDSPDGQDNGVKAHLHDEEMHGPHGGKTWDDLQHEQRESWKQKLKEAGYWAEDMGETILKGVVFGELAGVVGQAVAG